MNKSFLSVLKIRNFKLLWWSQVFSQIALNMITFALVIDIFEKTKSATSISLVMIATAIPIALFGPFSGAIADRINYKKILYYTNIFRFVAAIFLIASHNNVLALLEVMFIISALSQFFTPAESSSIPLIVPKEKIISANSTVMTTSYATLLIGYAIAGPIMHLTGSSYFYVICGGLYILAAFMIWKMSEFDAKENKKISLVKITTDVTEVWHEAKDGFNYLLRCKEILNPMIKLTIAWSMFGAFITLLPAFGETVLHIEPKFVGPFIIAPSGLGMILGAVFLDKNKKIDQKFLNTGFLIGALGLFVFSCFRLYEGFYIAKLIIVLTIIVAGFGTSIIQILTQTMLHLNSDEDKRGRVFGMSTMQLRLATSLPAIIVGGMSDLTSPFLTMLFLTSLFLLYSIWLFFEKKYEIIKVEVVN